MRLVLVWVVLALSWASTAEAKSIGLLDVALSSPVASSGDASPRPVDVSFGLPSLSPQSGPLTALLAGALSFVFPGLGQVVTGHVLRGVLLFGGVSLAYFFGFALMFGGGLTLNGAMAGAGLAIFAAGALGHLFAIVDAVLLGQGSSLLEGGPAGVVGVDPSRFRPVDALATSRR